MGVGVYRILVNGEGVRQAEWVADLELTDSQREEIVQALAQVARTTRKLHEVTVDYEYNDRGRGPKTHTVLRLDGKSVPVSLETTRVLSGSPSGRTEPSSWRIPAISDGWTREPGGGGGSCGGCGCEESAS